MKMKKIFLIGILVVLNTVAYSQTIVRFTNNSDKDVYASYVYWEAQSKRYNSQGWYKVPSYGTTDLNLGNYDGWIYVHGHQTKFWTESKWGSGYTFCIDKNDAFHIKGVDKMRSCNDTANFSKFTVKKGINNWYFNP